MTLMETNTLSIALTEPRIRRSVKMRVILPLLRLQAGLIGIDVMTAKGLKMAIRGLNKSIIQN